MATLYWNYAGVSTMWVVPGNWWSDPAHTVPAGAIPINGDMVYLDGTTMPTTGPGAPIWFSTVSTINATSGSLAFAVSSALISCGILYLYIPAGATGTWYWDGPSATSATVLNKSTQSCIIGQTGAVTFSSADRIEGQVYLYQCTVNSSMRMHGHSSYIAIGSNGVAGTATISASTAWTGRCNIYRGVVGATQTFKDLSLITTSAGAFTTSLAASTHKVYDTLQLSHALGGSTLTLTNCVFELQQPNANVNIQADIPFSTTKWTVASTDASLGGL